MRPALDAAEVAVRLGRALDAASLDHAIGGAIALGVHGVPRGTLDGDLRVQRWDEIVRMAGSA